MRGTSDANINFEGLRQLLNRLGFDERIRGSHHIYTKIEVTEIINLQPKGSKAKPYQVKTMIKYEVILYWSDEDNAFIAEVPELPGCMADGANYQEALANVEKIAQEWIETARELGREIPEPKGKLVYA